MNYRVHRLDINLEKEQTKLEAFLNTLDGDVISILPNIARTSFFQIYGISRKIDFLLIVEKID